MTKHDGMDRLVEVGHHALLKFRNDSSENGGHDSRPAVEAVVTAVMGALAVEWGRQGNPSGFQAVPCSRHDCSMSWRIRPLLSPEQDGRML